jgi:hypothetical protein
MAIKASGNLTIMEMGDRVNLRFEASDDPATFFAVSLTPEQAIERAAQLIAAAQKASWFRA